MVGAVAADPVDVVVRVAAVVLVARVVEAVEVVVAAAEGVAVRADKAVKVEGVTPSVAIAVETRRVVMAAQS